MLGLGAAEWSAMWGWILQGCECHGSGLGLQVHGCCCENHTEAWKILPNTVAERAGMVCIEKGTLFSKQLCIWVSVLA